MRKKNLVLFGAVSGILGNPSIRQVAGVLPSFDLLDIESLLTTIYCKVCLRHSYSLYDDAKLVLKTPLL